MNAPVDNRGFIRDSDLQARQRSVENIRKLTALQASIVQMIDEEQRLIGAAIPFADDRYDRQYSALCRAAFAVFQTPDLHETAIAVDPDWIDETVTPIRAGLCAEQVRA